MVTPYPIPWGESVYALCFEYFPRSTSDITFSTSGDLIILFAVI